MTPTPKRGDVALEVVGSAPASSGGASTSAPPRPPPYGASPPSDRASDRVSLRELADAAVEGRALVAVCVAAALVLGLGYAFVATPVYRTDAIVQVEDSNTTKGLLGDLSGAFGESSPAETEIEILRSRSLLTAVVKELRLDVVAEPRRFPLFGHAIARRYDGDGVAGALLGLSAYGWGGERIRVDRLDVSPELANKALTLVAGEGAKYAVFDADGAAVLGGEVGRVAAGRGVEMFVSELRARPGLEFTVARLDRDELVANLQGAIRISEKGKKTGILRLVLDGPEPAQIAVILDSLSRAYVRQNVERRSAEAGKTLAFLETQLPVLRANLEAAEAELESYRSRKGSVDVTLETQAALTRAVEIERAASELEVEHAALRQKFTEDHPALVALARKLRQLDGERESLEVRLKKLPEAELESARRVRDVKVANELYLVVLNKAQELKVVKEGTIGNVRVLDAAIVPVKPVAPRRKLAVLLSLAAGAALGLALAFARRAMQEGVEDPDVVERALGIGVHAVIPHSATQEEQARHQGPNDRKSATVLAADAPKDLAVESLRSLRTSLQFALVEAASSIVAISGPAPGVGKSFVTANLAHLLGESGKRVLAVDADLRRGRLHQYFGEERGLGLSDAIVGDAPAAAVIRSTHSPNVSLLTTGTLPPNPSELLGSERFQRLLAELAASHEIVLIDTPPVLAVTDGSLVARHAGVVFFVLKAGRHPMREIVEALKHLGRNGVRVHGIVMNGFRLERGLGRRSPLHYQYKY